MFERSIVYRIRYDDPRGVRLVTAPEGIHWTRAGEVALAWVLRQPTTTGWRGSPRPTPPHKNRV